MPTPEGLSVGSQSRHCYTKTPREDNEQELYVAEMGVMSDAMLHTSVANTYVNGCYVTRVLSPEAVGFDVFEVFVERTDKSKTKIH